ncbi:MAG: FmdB family zinc ribbon protein [Gemmatimonadota bacterium]
MPRYEYRCLECDEVFECCEGMEEHETSQPECPKCGSRKVERVFSSFYAKTRKKS